MNSNKEKPSEQEELVAVSSKEEEVPSNEEIEQLGKESVSPYAELPVEELSMALEEAIEQQGILEKEAEVAGSKATAAEAEILRMAADFQNARKRLDKMTQEMVAHAKEGMVTKLLSVLDDLDLAEANVPADLNSGHVTWFKGVTQIREKIIGVFQDENVGPIDTEGVFDPSRHEAVQMIPSEDHESGHIVETLRKGYMRGDKVIRPAMVRIAE